MSFMGSAHQFINEEHQILGTIIPILWCSEKRTTAFVDCSTAQMFSSHPKNHWVGGENPPKYGLEHPQLISILQNTPSILWKKLKHLNIQAESSRSICITHPIPDWKIFQGAPPMASAPPRGWDLEVLAPGFARSHASYYPQKKRWLAGKNDHENPWKLEISNWFSYLSISVHGSSNSGCCRGADAIGEWDWGDLQP